MRNLKKVLALVLALMMTLSLMVTASASDYKDDGDITKDVAVDVMSALEVFNGINGEFQPEGTLTRAQAAKIIAYLQLGPEAAEAYLPELANSQMFDDVQPGKWYAGAVNYCAGLGIVNGVGNNKFNPNAPVKGFEFAKMLLGALGYDASIEGFNASEAGSLWTLNISKKANGLSTPMNTNVKYGSNELTREEACQMAFNILTANTVKYNKDGDIDETGTPLGTSIFHLKDTTGTVTAVGETSTANSVNFAGNLGIEYLGHEVKVYYRTDEDGNNVADTVQDLSETVILTGVPGDANSGDTKAVRDKLAAAADWSGVPQYISAAGALGDGSNGGAASVSAMPETAGTTVVITDKVITAVVTPVTYKLDKVTEIKDDTYKSLEKTTAVAKGAWVGYDGIAKDDIVVIYTVADILYVEPAETVVGKVTAIDGTTFTVNGKDYKVEGTVTEGVVDAIDLEESEVGFTAEYTLYLNPNGTAFAIVGEADDTDSDSVLVYIVTHYDTNEATEYGDEPKHWIQCVTADGEIVVYQTNTAVDKDGKLVEVTADAENEGCYTVEEVSSSTSADGDVAFVEIKNNKATGTTDKTAGADKVLDGAKASVAVNDTEGTAIDADTEAKHYYDDAVKFIYVTGEKSTLKVETMDGRQTVTIKGEAADSAATDDVVKVIYTIEKAGENHLVKAVFVLQAYEAPEEYSDDVIFAAEGDGTVTAKAPYVNADGDTKSDGFKHTVYINGEKKDIVIADNAKKNGFYKYSMDGDAYKLTPTSADHLKVAADVTNMFNGLISTDAVTDLSVKGATVVNLTTDDTVPTDPTKLTTSHTVALVLNESKDAAVTIYVTAVAPAEEEEEEVPTSSAHNITEGTHVDQDNVITTVEFKVNGSKVTEAEKDDTVTIEVAATSGKTLTAKVNGGSAINLTESSGTYTGTFTMPDADAEVVITVA